MALITRIARLFQADMHSILDSIEEPHSALKQAMREMAAAIESGEQKIEVLARREERLGAYQAEQDKCFTETEQRIDLCFRADDENLARAMIRRKLEIEKRIKLTARERAALELEREKHARELSVQRAKLASVKEQMEILAKEDRHTPSTPRRALPTSTITLSLKKRSKWRSWPRESGVQVLDAPTVNAREERL